MPGAWAAAAGANRTAIAIKLSARAPVLLIILSNICCIEAEII
jgi:hypothetical protein